MLEKVKRILSNVITVLMVNESYQIPSFVEAYIRDYRRLHNYPQIAGNWGNEITLECIATHDTKSVKPKVVEILEVNSALSRNTIGDRAMAASGSALD